MLSHAVIGDHSIIDANGTWCCHHGVAMHLLQQVGQIKGGMNNAENMDCFYNCGTGSDAGIDE